MNISLSLKIEAPLPTDPKVQDELKTEIGITVSTCILEICKLLGEQTAAVSFVDNKMLEFYYSQFLQIYEIYRLHTLI